MDTSLLTIVISITVQIIGIGVFIGVTNTKLKYLEKKLDKHNCLVERMVVQEQSTKSAHRRLDELKDERR